MTGVQTCALPISAKKATSEILMRKYATRLDQNQRLRGARFSVHRGSDQKSPSVGSDFEFIEMIDLSKFAADDVTVMDLKVLEPNRDAMIRAVERLRNSSGGGQYQQGGYQPGAGVSNDDVVTTQVEYGDENDGVGGAGVVTPTVVE